MAHRYPLDAWMWIEACELLGRAERLQRQFFSPAASRATEWEPPVDVIDDGDALRVLIAMPGVPADRVQVLQQDGELLVRGVRPLPLAGGGERVLRLEIPYGRFERRIVLPPGTFELAPPQLEQGCLVLRLRRLGEGAA